MLGSFAYELPPLLPTDSPQMRPAGILIISCLLYAALAALLGIEDHAVAGERFKARGLSKYR